MATPETLAARQRIEREQAGVENLVCDIHGPQPTTQVCIECYAIQQERVERESLPLRMANTAEALRNRVLAELAKGNGHG